ncbi:cupredoxin domain-containing protein [Blastococcus brunescens]|uniref:Cupredoxin domain-containing protein n=1 Tax=Blastococcus brunescens TaxID=1564165 RepID=A0ABZ1AUT1_9ACTN|nr:cupredoxin domain-containing protein [Blastococcus sp. BMG 8361]WRL62340.1 cupredoxin domain-containing protein [Blastococcus sp. BMG 8361]
MSVPNVIRPGSRRRLPAVLLAVALGSLTACGGSDSPDTDGASAPTTQAQPSEAAPAAPSAPSAPAAEGDVQTVTAVEEDFSISVDAETLSAGEIEIEVRNEGSASHDLVIEQDGEDIARTAVIEPGASETLTVTLEPGEYVFYCSIANHRGMGMELPVTVS